VVGQHAQPAAQGEALAQRGVSSAVHPCVSNRSSRDRIAVAVTANNNIAFDAIKPYSATHSGASDAVQ
jgi:hypothetical protein